VYYNDFVTAKASGNAGTKVFNQLFLGAASWSAGAYSFDGYVAEILIKAGADSAANRAQMRSYFSARYQI
jgi:hypothetical protein